MQLIMQTPYSKMNFELQPDEVGTPAKKCTPVSGTEDKQAIWKTLPR